MFLTGIGYYLYYMQKIVIVLIALLSFSSANTIAQNRKTFVEGVDYYQISPLPVLKTPDAEGKVVVNYVFRYDAPYCYFVDLEIMKWCANNPKVKLNRIPMSRTTNDPLTRLFATIKNTKYEQVIGVKTYQAIFIDDIVLNTDEDVIKWLSTQKIDLKWYKRKSKSLLTEKRVLAYQKMKWEAPGQIYINNQFYMDEFYYPKTTKLNVSDLLDYVIKKHVKNPSSKLSK